ncbi:DUF2334 domain-containing protein [Coraliomargarita sp. SDUM461004]|uniref:DUF2334 domain-containing protein n=1 Tax=Thalassobacterium sedimentorum TaxID=3041258 RepID=A0ABU1AIN2_9BACT|nr:DUF2334 domain-containing protein [Coraliomargarita sp. SDUM461004]MDQ8194682.1 DUF2334 domain-containing protein [Coraliomargarita sp. SDUM461004]
MSTVTTMYHARGATGAPMIVIKADDLLYRSDGTIFGSGWNRFIEIAAELDIKISVGIICKSLANGEPEYFDRIRALHNSGQIEFWNHGFTHARNKETGESEFSGPDFETQLDTIARGQALALEKLGFAFRAFGSPFNANDANTTRAMREHPELISWLYGPKNANLLPGQIILGRVVNLEHPVHHPNFEAFKRGFLKNPNHPYYVLQAHPNSWDYVRFEEFEKIVNFLKERGAEFITPTELVRRLRAEK